ncbi:MAG: hypothetical protein ABSG04_07685 [Verrucomicrobiota bacterium]
MKTNNFKSILAAALSALVLLGTSCVSTPDGHSKFGVPWVYKDTLTRRYSRTVEQVAAATRVVFTRNGRLLVDNSVDNTFKAKINERTVWAKITKVDDKTTQLEVMARTAMGADIDLAAEQVTQIALQLTVTP